MGYHTYISTLGYALVPEQHANIEDIDKKMRESCALYRTVDEFKIYFTRVTHEYNLDGTIDIKEYKKKGDMLGSCSYYMKAYPEVNVEGLNEYRAKKINKMSIDDILKYVQCSCNYRFDIEDIDTNKFDVGRLNIVKGKKYLYNNLCMVSYKTVNNLFYSEYYDSYELYFEVDENILLNHLREELIRLPFGGTLTLDKAIIDSNK